MDYAQTTRRLWSIYSPILLLFGLSGNSLSLVVSSRRSMRGIASSLYLIAIAVADNGTLLFGLIPKWIQFNYGIDITTFNNVICKARNFLFYTSQDSSSWLVCAFTFDRFLVVQFPLRRAIIGATRRVYLSISTVVLLAVVKNSTIFWSRAVVYRQISSNHTGDENGTAVQAFCSNPTESSAYYDTYVRPWIVFTMADCLPFLFLITCNVAIVRKMLTVHYKSAKQLSASNVISRTLPVIGISRSRVARMTGLCLAVSITFLVLEFPSIVLLIGRPYRTTTPGDKYALVEAVASLLTYTNSAVNFYLYCMAGARFRKEFVSMINRDRHRKHLSKKFVRSKPSAGHSGSSKRRMTEFNLIEGHEVLNDEAGAKNDKRRTVLVHQISRPSRSSTM